MEFSYYKPVIKLLLVVMVTELLIMVIFHELSAELAPWLEGTLDVVLLGVITATVAQLWIVQPLAKACESDAMFRAIAEGSDTGLVITDPQQDHSIVYVNSAFTRMTGYTMAEVKGKHPRLLSEGLGQQPDRGNISKAIQSGSPVHGLMKNKRKNGEIFWNDLHLNPIYLSGNAPTYWLGLLHDVSETRALHRQIEQLASAVEQADDMICIFDQDGQIDFVNRSFSRKIGLHQEFTGQSIWPYWCEDGCSEELVKQTLQLKMQWSGRNQWTGENNQPFEAMTNISSIDGEDGQCMFIAVIRDMTEEIEMNEQLVHAQKMEAVGTLAGGIAHDFNNMLAAMMGNLYLLKKQLHADVGLVTRIQTIEEQGHRGANLIRQMLVFARKESVMREDFDLRILGKETMKLLDTSIPENISLHVDMDDAPMMLHGDASLLQSCLFNLVNNARDAVDGQHDAMINISMHIVPIASIAKNIARVMDKHSENSMQDCIHLSITDNGSGMDKQTQARVFEPYFSTKDVGRGTGLGLPMVMGCIDMHGGWIELTSELGEGTSFDIYLPLKSSAVEDKALHETDICPGNGELILLADDNEMLCASICETLEDAGYRVIRSSDGENALQQYVQHKVEVRMAILDCVMPKRSGIEVAKQIWHLSGGTVKTVLMTGYDLSHSLDMEWPDGERPLVLQKPWKMEQLNAALQEMDRNMQ